MSLTQNLLFSGMRQSLGNLVTTTCHGQNVVKAKVFMPRNVNSIAQQHQRASFKLLMDAYSSFGGITDKGFPGRPVKYSPCNVFLKVNLSSAIDNTDVVPVVDYSKLIVSDGSLPDLVITNSTIGATGITISFENDVSIANVKASDQVIAFVKLKSGSLKLARQVRGALVSGSVLIQCPNINVDDVVCCYIFIMNDLSTKASKSVYVPLS